MSSPVEKKDLPFIELSVTCPMCQKDSPQRVLKDEAYSVLKLDIDLRPLSYKWNNSAFQHLSPICFYIRQCPFCLYAANEEYYEDPAIDLTCSNSHFKKWFHVNLQEDAVLKEVVAALTQKSEQDTLYLATIKKF